MSGVGWAQRLRRSGTLIFSAEAAFHFNTRRDFFTQAYRALKPGGSLLVADILLDGEHPFSKKMLAWDVPANLDQSNPDDPGFRPAAIDPRGRGPKPAADVEHRGDRVGRPGDQPIDERRRCLLGRAGRIAPQADVVVFGVAVPTAHRRREDDAVIKNDLWFVSRFVQRWNLLEENLNCRKPQYAPDCSLRSGRPSDRGGVAQTLHAKPGRARGSARS